MTIGLLVDYAAAIVLRVVGAGAIALTFFLVAHELPIEDAGYYGLLSSLVLLGKYLGPFGYDQLGVKLLAGSDRSEILAQGMHLLKQASRANLVVTGLAVLVAGASMRGSLTHGIWIMACGISVYWCCMLSGCMSTLLRLTGRTRIAIFGDMVLGPVCTLAGTGVWITRGGLDLNSSIVWLAIGPALAVGLQAALLRTSRGDAPRPPMGGLSFSEAFRLWRVQLVSYLQTRSLSPIAFALGGATATAITELAFKVALVPTLLTWTFQMVAGPSLAAAARRGNTTHAHRLLVGFGALGASATLLYTALYFVVGRQAVEHYVGPRYHTATWPTLIILSANVINSSFGLTSILMLYDDRDAVVFRFTVGAAALCLLSAPVFSHYFGYVGVAMAFFTGVAARDVGLSAFAFGLPRMARVRRHPVIEG